ncbi:hypothetical protein [Roseibium album]|uniref:hypothetical protein n=1 Tax=Roseibium album TaxID=311410 RepID=UPI0032968FE5
MAQGMRSRWQPAVRRAGLEGSKVRIVQILAGAHFHELVMAFVMISTRVIAPAFTVSMLTGSPATPDSGIKNKRNNNFFISHAKQEVSETRNCSSTKSTYGA